MYILARGHSIKTVSIFPIRELFMSEVQQWKIQVSDGIIMDSETMKIQGEPENSRIGRRLLK